MIAWVCITILVGYLYKQFFSRGLLSALYFGMAFPDHDITNIKILYWASTFLLVQFEACWRAIHLAVFKVSLPNMAKLSRQTHGERKFSLQWIPRISTPSLFSCRKTLLWPQQDCRLRRRSWGEAYSSQTELHGSMRETLYDLSLRRHRHPILMVSRRESSL